MTLPTSPYAGHYETAGLDEAWQEGFKAGRAEWEATIDGQLVVMTRNELQANDEDMIGSLVARGILAFLPTGAAVGVKDATASDARREVDDEVV